MKRILANLAVFVLPCFAMADAVIYDVVESEGYCVHMLRVDPSEASLEIVKCPSTESTSAIARENNAIAAVNGGFYRGEPLKGVASGLLKILGSYHGSADRGRGVVGWDQRGRCVMDRLTSMMVLLTDSGKSLLIDGLNTPRSGLQVVIYTADVGSRTPKSEKIIEYPIDRNGIVGAPVMDGETEIPEGGMVVSMPIEYRLDGWVGSSATLDFRLQPLFSQKEEDLWKSMDYLLGSSNLLLMNGKIVDFEGERVFYDFLQNPFPRTAMGVLENGSLLFVMVEPRGEGKGMKILELAEFLQDQGCLCAINLCGGNSSTLWYKGELFYVGPEEKSVGNVIVIKERHAS